MIGDNAALKAEFQTPWHGARGAVYETAGCAKCSIPEQSGQTGARKTVLTTVAWGRRLCFLAPSIKEVLTVLLT